MLQAPSPHAPTCAYCGDRFAPWPASVPVEPCSSCKRPTLFLPIPWSRPSRLVVTGLLDAGASLYGVATICLIVAFALTPTSVREFVKAFTLMLFVIATVLAVDGILAIRTAIDRTWSRRRFGSLARGLGIAKITAAAAALTLMITGMFI